jgi:hypothetical protein
MMGPGDFFTPGAEPIVSPGVRAIVFDVPDGIYIPWIHAEHEGGGDVGRYLDGLPRDRRIVFPTVMNQRLVGMLERRGFVQTHEWSPEFAKNVEIWERHPTP